MNRRSLLTLLATPAVARLLTACGGDDGVSEGTSVPATGDARSELARVAAPEADAAVAVAALNAFGDDVFATVLAAAPEANLVFSPASIAIALAMTSGGAVSDTLAAMDATLHITDPATIHRSMNALDTALAARNQTAPASGDESPDEVQLSIANSLWGQQGFSFVPAFLDLLATEYGADVHLVDYRDDAEAARQAINAWVAAATAERIPALLPDGAVTEDTRLTLVNAIYLKATWSLRFDREATSDAEFTGVDGSTVDVPTMHQQVFLGYASGDGWQAVDLPYSFGDLAMTIVVPTDRTATPPVAEAIAALATREVRLALPKFDIETSTSLNDTLGALAMGVAFTSDADFTAMTTTEPVWIGEVVHQANITVDEDGTEAAAATAVGMAGSAAPTDPPVEVNVDRPFLFAVRDIPTGAIVFRGRVTDPSATR